MPDVSKQLPDFLREMPLGVLAAKICEVQRGGEVLVASSDDPFGQTLEKLCKLFGGLPIRSLRSPWEHVQSPWGALATTLVHSSGIAMGSPGGSLAKCLGGLGRILGTFLGGPPRGFLGEVMPSA